MKLRDAKPNTSYIVIKGSKDDTFQRGDKLDIDVLFEDVFIHDIEAWINVKNSVYLDEVVVEEMD
jgi:hypothetical protein